MILVDLEASGLHAGSYPTEVAWCSLDLRRGGSYLIRPTEEWRASPWSVEAEAITGISRSLLAVRGLPPAEVAACLNAELGESSPCTDNPEYDGRWLRMLHDAVGIPPSYAICPEPPAVADRAAKEAWDRVRAQFDVDAVVAAVAGRGRVDPASLELEQARLIRAANLVAHRGLDDAIGHALQLGIAELWAEHRASGPRSVGAEVLVRRARIMKITHGRTTR